MAQVIHDKTAVTQGLRTEELSDGHRCRGGITWWFVPVKCFLTPGKTLGLAYWDLFSGHTVTVDWLLLFHVEFWNCKDLRLRDGGFQF